jgi:two-component system chemotaxis response regulator CheY
MRNSRAAVLVVDDQADVVQLIVNLLQRLGFTRIDTAFDGVSALERIARTEYDLIISDFQMDPMSGLDLLRAVRSNWRTRSATFLMMAGGTEVEKVSAASHAGMDGYLLKPFRASALGTKIENAFRTRRVGAFV